MKQQKLETMSKYSKTPKMTQVEKLAFYNENGYFFGTTPKATISGKGDFKAMLEVDVKAIADAEYKQTVKLVDDNIATNCGYTEAEMSTKRQMKNL